MTRVSQTITPKDGTHENKSTPSIPFVIQAFTPPRDDRRYLVVVQLRAAVAGSQTARSRRARSRSRRRGQESKRQNQNSVDVEADCFAASCSYTARYGTVPTDASPVGADTESHANSQASRLASGASFLKSATAGLQGCTAVPHRQGLRLMNMVKDIIVRLNKQPGPKLQGEIGCPLLAVAAH